MPNSAGDQSFSNAADDVVGRHSPWFVNDEDAVQLDFKSDPRYSGELTGESTESISL